MAGLVYYFPPDQVRELRTWRFMLYFTIPRRKAKQRLRAAVRALREVDFQVITFPSGLHRIFVEPGQPTVCVPIEVPDDRRAQPASLAAYESEFWKLCACMMEQGFGEQEIQYVSVDWEERTPGTAPQPHGAPLPVGAPATAPPNESGMSREEAEAILTRTPEWQKVPGRVTDPDIARERKGWKKTYLQLGTLGLIVGIYGIWSTGGDLYRGWKASRWPTTTGTVTSCEVESYTPPRMVWEDEDEKIEPRYRLKISYKYKVEARRYTSHRLSPNTPQPHFGSKSTAQELVDGKLAAGGEVTVYYDPDDPASAVLLPKWGLGEGAWGMFGAGIAFLLIGVFSVVQLVRHRLA